MIDYVPLDIKYPELDLVPTSKVVIDISNFQSRFDYVQNLRRKDKNGNLETFHLLLKKDKEVQFGVLYYSCGCLLDSSRIALPANYEKIVFIYKKNESFGAIIKQNGKFGLFFWELGIFSANKYLVTPEYDSMEMISNERIKAVKEDVVTYFDDTGHILK